VEGDLRRIPLSHRSHVTGFQSLRTGLTEHESALERDFVTLSSFRDTGAVLTAQPVTIRFEHEGRPRRYTPDFRVAWSDGVIDIVEIKYRVDLRANWYHLRPAFLRVAVAILHTGHRDRLLAQMPDLSGEMRERLRAILLPAAASPAQGKGSWRGWINKLPESGAALCERALGERYRLRRRRLFALAAIRDGATVPDAAESVGMKPRAIYRLLDCGARHGLEVALERPRRRNNKLSGAQAEMLGRWVASARPHHHRKAIIAQALAMFGVRLNSDEAYAVLRMHRRAKPGRRRRLWKPWPRKYTIIAEPNHDSAPSS
jgi:transposase